MHEPVPARTLVAARISRPTGPESSRRRPGRSRSSSSSALLFSRCAPGRVSRWGRRRPCIRRGCAWRWSSAAPRVQARAAAGPDVRMRAHRRLRRERCSRGRPAAGSSAGRRGPGPAQPFGSMHEPPPARTCVLLLIVPSPSWCPLQPSGQMVGPSPARSRVLMLIAASFSRWGPGRNPCRRGPSWWRSWWFFLSRWDPRPAPCRRGCWSWRPCSCSWSAVVVDAGTDARADGGVDGHGASPGVSRWGRCRSRARRGCGWWSAWKPLSSAVVVHPGAGARADAGGRGHLPLLA
jgi:hypothetical protein